MYDTKTNPTLLQKWAKPFEWGPRSVGFQIYIYIYIIIIILKNLYGFPGIYLFYL
jgi:hypothetical protein